MSDVAARDTGEPGPTDVSIALLGPLEVRAHSTEISIHGVMPRALLASLALRGSHAVTTWELIDGLWGAELPRSPLGSLQIAASRLRKALVDDGARLLSLDGAYRLDVRDDQIDARRAQRLLEQARAARRASDASLALQCAESGFALWRGTPLAEFERFPFAQWATSRLDELRVALVEERNEALLASGRHLEVIELCIDLVPANPWRETLRAHQMLALYRAGRQADSLHAYELLRASLAEELGIAPSPQVVTLHSRILQQDPTLDLVTKPHREGWVPLATSELTSTSTPFVGRDAELQELAAAWRDAVRAGEPRFVHVEGEPGVGKTRLALEGAQRVARKAIVLIGRCDEDWRAPYQPFVEILEQLLRSLPERDARRLVRGASDELRRLLPEVGDRRRAQQISSADHDAARAFLVADVIRVFVAAAEIAPIYLVLDDLNWSSGATLALVEELASYRAPLRVVIVATARTNEPDRSYHVDELVERLRAMQRARRMTLAGLSEEDITEMVRHAELDAEPSVGALVHSATAGNAFFAGEVLRDLQERRADLTDLRSIDVPVDVAAAARYRFGRLGRAAVEVLGVAAVVGRAFRAKTLREATCSTDAGVHRALDRAIAAQLVEPGRADEFRFSHDLTRLSLLNTIPAERQTALHVDIARSLESDAGAPPAVIADHWIRAGDAHRADAFKWSVRAGHDADALLDPFEAVRWFAVAVDTAADEHARLEMSVELGRSQFLAGYPEHRQTLLEVGRRARALGDTDILTRAGEACANGWASNTAVDRERVGLLQAAADVATGATRASILASLATELAFDSDDERRRRISDDALAVARDSGDPAALAYVLSSRCHSIWCPATLDERVANTEELERIVAQHNDPLQEQRVLGAAMIVAVERAELAKVDECLDASTRLAADTGLPMFVWGTAIHRAWRHALRGDLDGAEALVDEARDIGRRTRQPATEAVYAAQLVCLRWQQHRLAEMVDVLDRLVRVAPDLPALRGAYALAHIEAGDDNFASAALRAAASVDFADIHLDILWSLGLWTWIEAAVALGDTDTAAHLAARLAPWQDQVAFTSGWVLGPIALPVAVAMDASGRTAKARDSARRAVAIADRLDAAWLLPDSVRTLASGPSRSD